MERVVMHQKGAFFPPSSSFKLPPAAMTMTLMIYLALTVGLSALMAIPFQSPLLGLLGAVIINLIVLFFVRSEFALACYLIVAGPSVSLSLASSGLLSRLYLGNMLFFLVTLSWLLFKVLPTRIAARKFLRPTLLAPLLLLILVGLTSLIASHLSP